MPRHGQHNKFNHPISWNFENHGFVCVPADKVGNTYDTRPTLIESTWNKTKAEWVNKLTYQNPDSEKYIQSGGNQHYFPRRFVPANPAVPGSVDEWKTTGDVYSWWGSPTGDGGMLSGNAYSFVSNPLFVYKNGKKFIEINISEFYISGFCIKKIKKEIGSKIEIHTIYIIGLTNVSQSKTVLSAYEFKDKVFTLINSVDIFINTGGSSSIFWPIRFNRDSSNFAMINHGLNSEGNGFIENTNGSISYSNEDFSISVNISRVTYNNHVTGSYESLDISTHVPAKSGSSSSTLTHDYSSSPVSYPIALDYDNNDVLSFCYLTSSEIYHRSYTKSSSYSTEGSTDIRYVNDILYVDVYGKDRSNSSSAESLDSYKNRSLSFGNLFFEFSYSEIKTVSGSGSYSRDDYQTAGEGRDNVDDTSINEYYSQTMNYNRPINEDLIILYVSIKNDALYGVFTSIERIVLPNYSYSHGRTHVSSITNYSYGAHTNITDNTGSIRKTIELREYIKGSMVNNTKFKAEVLQYTNYSNNSSHSSSGTYNPSVEISDTTTNTSVTYDSKKVAFEYGELSKVFEDFTQTTLTNGNSKNTTTPFENTTTTFIYDIPFFVIKGYFGYLGNVNNSVSESIDYTKIESKIHSIFNYSLLDQIFNFNTRFNISIDDRNTDKDTNKLLYYFYVDVNTNINSGFTDRNFIFNNSILNEIPIKTVKFKPDKEPRNYIHGKYSEFSNPDLQLYSIGLY